MWNISLPLLARKSSSKVEPSGFSAGPNTATASVTLESTHSQGMSFMPTKHGAKNSTSTKTTMNITAPTVHLNGTGYQDLWNGYEAAFNAVRAAQEALGKIKFHSRDYYVQDAGAWSKAQDHRIEQAKALAQVEEYLLQHLIELQEQKK